MPVAKGPGQTQQLPVSEPPKDSVLAVDGLVNACDIGIGIAAGAGILQKVQNRSARRGICDQLAQKERRCWIDEVGCTWSVGRQKALCSARQLKGMGVRCARPGRGGG